MRLPVLRRVAIAFVASGSLVASVAPAAAAGPVVISQAYGGGGNTGATFTHDFVELFNRSSAPVSLEGWSLQYTSATGTGNFGASATLITPLSGTLAPGQYLLVQEGQGSGGTTPLPAPFLSDASPIAMAAGAGKLALVNTTTPLGCNGSTTVCSPEALATIVDLLGYGNANFFEGSGAAPTASNTTAVFRAGAGCSDSDDNAADFAAGPPNPRNQASPPAPCDGPTPPSGVGAADPASLPAGASSLLSVTVTPGGNPVSTGITVVANLTAIGGGAAQDLFDDGSNGDATPGDNVFSFLATVAAGTPAGAKSLPALIADAEARSAGTSIPLTVEPPLVAIHEIQGPGLVSPLSGLVATSGIVTGRKSNGFFIQAPDAEADADPNTSEGVFVFTSAAPPAVAAVGSLVRVTATIQEFVPSQDPASPPITELVSPSVTLVSSGHELPAATTLGAADTDPSGSLTQLERLEGMRVHVAALSVVAPTQGSISEPNATSTSNGVFYGVIPGIARPFREAGIAASDPLPAGAPCCVPRFDENPERLRVDSDGLVGAAPLEVTTGATVSGITGPLDFGFRTWTLLADPPPAAPPSVGGVGAAVPVRAPAADEFTVSSFNLQRLFDTVNDPDTSEPVLTDAAFASRLQKISLAIRSVLGTPDILGVVEVENLATLQALAARINADAVAAGQPDPAYVGYLVEGNDVGGIDSGFLVKGARVNVTGVTQEGKDATYLNPLTGLPELLNDRPPLVLLAEVQAPSGPASRVTVIVNHLRSLNDVADPVDGPRVRAKRAAQAEFLANLVQARQLADATEAIALVGDFNAFEVNDGLVDSIGTIKGTPAPPDEVVLASGDLVDPDLTDLVELEPAAQRYSYSFDGNAQTLDHVLVNPPLLAKLRDFEHARLDADFPESFRNDPGRPERNSDHDAPVAFFRFAQADLSASKSAPASVATGAALSYTLGASNLGPDAAEAVVVSDPLPAGTTFEAVAAPAGWECSVPAVGESGSVSCAASGLAAGASASLLISARASCALPSGAVLSNTASISGATADPFSGNDSATATSLVSNPPPVISGISVDRPVLWPPFLQLVPVTVSYTVSDNCDPNPSCTLSVTSDEAQGLIRPDWIVVDAHHVRLRAERNLFGNGRVYTIRATCTDSAGAASSASVNVRVPIWIF